ncbi:MAG: helix-turn-helix domain-containing protein [Gemmatimonadales bacterium]|nr:helix-turn-helix domain-containing protein [Gemmatimonadales bacterium]
MPDPMLFTVKQASKRLNMSEAWLFASDIPHVKLGRRRLYRSTDLDAYVNRHVRR